MRATRTGDCEDCDWKFPTDGCRRLELNDLLGNDIAGTMSRVALVKAQKITRIHPCTARRISELVAIILNPLLFTV